ncbi:methyltransferase family protein [Candidatus Magnetomonas plexicatena]|uniref:methyltransferase family protein n=1 Tax=Candidatus Magnetomonas plexicatena TaxID=2552947 RepID=UPI001C774B31|nr:isoprenylcysteine carboxylmethyltransferase family protein [Nitrospirales bacterium LBB_01]
MNKSKTFFSAAAVFYFIIGLEVLIMISPFAGFFYSAFNPFLLATSKFTATRWLSVFFLPHMVVPPDAFLKFIRVMGSVFFVGGISLFFICAFLVYRAKFLKKGAVVKGLYTFIRHPQYAALITAGIGLAVLWPRFLVLVLWLFMVLCYYLLSKDEEQRMLKLHNKDYSRYMTQTGMFLPKRIEQVIMPRSVTGGIAAFVLLSVITIATGFSLRSYTISHLSSWTDNNNITAVSIMNEDKFKMDHRMAQVLEIEEIKSHIKADEKYLVYFLPPNYIMQGLIADTGDNWKLYKQHHAISMITDWVFHPFSHLCQAHSAMEHNGNVAAHMKHRAAGTVIRKLIFLKIPNVNNIALSGMLAINAKREPQFMADVDIHNLKLITFKELSGDTGWGNIPVPTF